MEKSSNLATSDWYKRGKATVILEKKGKEVYSKISHRAENNGVYTDSKILSNTSRYLHMISGYLCHRYRVLS